MSEDKALHRSAPTEPAVEEDWGEDWGDVTAATPDINEVLEMHITDLLVDRGQDSSGRS